MSEHDFYEEEEFTTQFNGQTLRRIAGQLKPYWPWVVGFLSLIVVVSSLDSYFTYLSKRLIDEGIVAQDRAAATTILTQYASLILVQAISVFGFIYMTGILGEKVRFDLRKSMFTRLQTLSLGYYNKTPVGWIISRVTSDTDRVAELVTWGMLDVTWAIANIATSIFFMWMISPQLTMIVGLIIPVIIVVAAEFKKRILVEYRNVRRVNSKITGHYNETITGVRVIKALRREEANQGEFQELTDEMYDAGYRAAWLSALFLPTVQLIASLAVGAVIFYSGVQANIGIRQHDRRRHPGLHLVHHLHALAHQRDGAGLRRHAVGHRLGRAHLLAARLRAGGGRQGRRLRSGHACRATSSSITSSSPTRKTSRCWQTSACTYAGARPSPWSARPAAANRPSSTWSVASTSRPAA